MTSRFRPTYWQLESSSLQYIARDSRIKETSNKNEQLLKTCPDICFNKECPCLLPSE